jgi:hypothetical protein
VRAAWGILRVSRRQIFWVVKWGSTAGGTRGGGEGAASSAEVVVLLQNSPRGFEVCNAK